MGLEKIILSVVTHSQKKNMARCVCIMTSSLVDPDGKGDGK